MENPINQRIKDLLAEKRWTVNSLSKALNISQPTLSRQISGVVSMDSKVICGVLLIWPDISAEWLMRGTGEMKLADNAADAELKAMYIDQGREIYRLKQMIAELEGEGKNLA